MGYDIHSYIGEKMHRNIEYSSILSKISFILFKKPFILRSPISNKDAKEIGKKMILFANDFEQHPEKYDNYQIEHPEKSYKMYMNSIHIKLQHLDYIRQVANFYKNSKGIITNKEYNDLFYPYICNRCDEYLEIVINNQNEFVCLQCNMKYSKDQVNQIINRENRNMHILQERKKDVIGVTETQKDDYWD